MIKKPLENVTTRSIAHVSEPYRRDATFGFSQSHSPTKCPDCNSKLQPVTYERFRISHNCMDNAFRRWCNCGCYIEWSYPNVWIRRHELPIMDMKEMRIIIQTA